MKWIKKGDETSIKEVVLRNLGTTTDEMNVWITKHNRNEYRINGLEKAASIIKQYKDRPVWISGDYDVDGITATTIMLKALKMLGFKDVHYMIPARSEGFGISVKMVDNVPAGALLITVDNGLAQIEAIEAAKKKGITVIITDHHLPEVLGGEEIQNPADVVIDPKGVANQADFDDYCGAGLAYKLAFELLQDKTKCYELLALATIGTIADCVTLREENYAMCRKGFKVLSQISLLSTGLYALLSALKLLEYIDEDSVGFTLAPTINAASRMQDNAATQVVALLTTDASFEAALCEAAKLVDLNTQRKKLQEEARKKALEIIEQNGYQNDVPLVVYIPNVKASLVGPIAGDLAEGFKVPAIVVTDDNGILKGSARTYGDFHVKKALEKVSFLLLHYGGHAGGAGLALEKSNFQLLHDAMQDTGKDYVKPETDVVEYDIDLVPANIATYFADLRLYAPFGQGNPKPVFRMNGFCSNSKSGCSYKKLGESGNTVKVNGNAIDALSFKLADRFTNVDPAAPIQMDMVGTLSLNHFKGKEYPQMLFTDCVIH